MTEKIFLEITEWQNKTFPEATALSKLHHLKEEVVELEKELIEGGSFGDLGLELADCFLLLFGCASKAGLTYEGIINFIEWKMQINYKREWGVPDTNGVVKHISTKNQLQK